MRRWTPWQRIICFSSVGWIGFCVFSREATRWYLIRIGDVYGWDWLNFPYWGIVSGAAPVGLALLLGVSAFRARQNKDIDFFRLLMTAMIIITLLGLLAMPHHLGNAIAICWLINSGLVIALGLSFYPR